MDQPLKKFFRIFRSIRLCVNCLSIELYCGYNPRVPPATSARGSLAQRCCPLPLYQNESKSSRPVFRLPWLVAKEHTCEHSNVRHICNSSPLIVELHCGPQTLMRVTIEIATRHTTCVLCPYRTLKEQPLVFHLYQQPSCTALSPTSTKPAFLLKSEVIYPYCGFFFLRPPWRSSVLSNRQYTEHQVSQDRPYFPPE